MAEGVGFEPTVPVKGRQFSRLEQSTALPPFRRQISYLRKHPRTDVYTIEVGARGRACYQKGPRGARNAMPAF